VNVGVKEGSRLGLQSMIFYECIHSYGDGKEIIELGKDRKESSFPE
jgi:hypothetical protein